ncbi:SIMPL domain-containing protein [Candidatus Woesearchaeota archaeon]|nr:SIMPL domain-containing protein [Candidatus Woesearchaeota archaeon]
MEEAKKHSFIHSLVFTMLFAILILSFISVVNNKDAEKNSITVSGEASDYAQPDEATLILSINTEAATTLEAQRKGSELNNNVINALKRYGLKENQIQTLNYNIYPKYDYDPERRREPRITGYVFSVSLKISTQEFTKIGEIADVAIENGATNMDSISFDLSDKKKDELRNTILAKASENARNKASSKLKLLKMPGVRP